MFQNSILGVHQEKFKRRVQGTAVPGYPNIRATDALGHVYTVHPNNFECFFLRLLLHTVRGPTSYEALRTVNGRICVTFREACRLDIAAGQFAQQLLSLGDGKIAADPTSGLITIPNNSCNLVDSLETLKNSVFPDIQRCLNDHK